MSRYKISNDADFLAAVFISSLAHNHKRHAAASARVKSQYTGVNCNPSGSRCLHITLISEADGMCSGGCGTKLMTPPCNELTNNSEVVYVDLVDDCTTNSHRNTVVLCMSCSNKLRIWKDE